MTDFVVVDKTSSSIVQTFDGTQKYSEPLKLLIIKVAS